MSITQKALTEGRHPCSTEGCKYRTNKRNDGCAICKQKAAQQRYRQKAIEKQKEQHRQTNIAKIELEKDLINYNYPLKIRKGKSTRNKKYKDAQKELLEKYGAFCAGCGTSNEKLSTSHRVPEKEPEGKPYIEDVRNLDLLCLTCHENVEHGMYHLLRNGKEVSDWIESVAPKYYKRKLAQADKILRMRKTGS